MYCLSNKQFNKGAHFIPNNLIAIVVFHWICCQRYFDKTRKKKKIESENRQSVSSDKHTDGTIEKYAGASELEYHNWKVKTFIWVMRYTQNDSIEYKGKEKKRKKDT